MGGGAEFRRGLLVDAAEFEMENAGQAEFVVVTVVEGDLAGDGGARRPDLALTAARRTTPRKQAAQPAASSCSGLVAPVSPVKLVMISKQCPMSLASKGDCITILTGDA
ncbi:hypothetical protein [Streptomyces jeddahensis]|uniref:Uncharacterized protein n=1 Tax=Streptomyces jeddahensis TaxID=1716141 RepID=A0A177HXU6_9ACTN|nr:hypothetical protein STSP_11800 [Streptomyces jeddahensis]